MTSGKFIERLGLNGYLQVAYPEDESLHPELFGASPVFPAFGDGEGLWPRLGGEPYALKGARTVRGGETGK